MYHPAYIGCKKTPNMEKNKITVFCENNGQEYQIPTGSSLKEFKKIVFPMNHQNILGALVNNEVQDLHYEIYNPKYEIGRAHV